MTKQPKNKLGGQQLLLVSFEFSDIPFKRKIKSKKRSAEEFSLEAKKVKVSWESGCIERCDQCKTRAEMGYKNLASSDQRLVWAERHPLPA